MTLRRIAIVTPWYGAEATGGAESLARELAARLAVTDNVTILTTTARSFHSDWSENFYKAGRTRESGYDVLRFRLRHRDNEAFHRLNGELLQMLPAQWPGLTRNRTSTDGFIEESINSTSLEEYLQGREAAKYDAVVFLPYLYGVVIRGIEAFPGRAHLIPCLHDEVYARLPRIEDAIHRASTLLFNSDGEAELALRIYGPGILHKSHVIGTGIPAAAGDDGSAPVDGPYFLFLGRRDATKGVDFLIESFSQHRRSSSSTHSLVLAGPGNASYHDPERGIIDLGFVDERTKCALIRRALALVQPSVNESYSRVMMEAWRERIPVIARADCLATATAVARSGGGIVAGGLSGWADAFSHLEAAPVSDLEELGRRGADFAAIHSDWSRVVDRFRDATGLSAGAVLAPRGKRVDQVVETMAYGDAISNYTRSLRAHLHTQGYDASIFARVVQARVAEEADPFSSEALATSDVLLYHHSIAFNEIQNVLSAPGSKALIYHNITPPAFFREYDYAFAEHLENGRLQLAGLAGSFATAGADSEFNACELRELGFQNVKVVPVPVSFTRFDVTPAPVAGGKGGTEWLFVGRISPNKGLRQLIAAFEIYACVNGLARLVLVGAYDPADRYYQELAALVIERSLEANVAFAGIVDEATLTAYYRNADVYVCLSEHEGFCVPLVEAMYFDIPIVASANAAITETLGDAGILVDPSADPFEIAALIRTISTDDDLRQRLIESQRRRRTAFDPERIFSIVDKFIAEIA